MTAASLPPTSSTRYPSATTPAATCIRLSKLPGLEDLRLAAWAHMLGFSGHFSTKSRTYSTTLGALRADRATHQRELAIAAGLLPDLTGETTVVHADWHFTGRAEPLPTLRW